jgi:hypothetical protein
MPGGPCALACPLSRPTSPRRRRLDPLHVHRSLIHVGDHLSISRPANRGQAVDARVARAPARRTGLLWDQRQAEPFPLVPSVFVVSGNPFPETHQESQRRNRSVSPRPAVVNGLPPVLQTSYRGAGLWYNGYLLFRGTPSPKPTRNPSGATGVYHPDPQLSTDSRPSSRLRTAALVFGIMVLGAGPHGGLLVLVRETEQCDCLEAYSGRLTSC